MIEKPPVLPNEPTEKACQIVFDKKYRSLIEKINTEYMYWDKVKYYTPEGVGQKDFWYAVKLSRFSNSQTYDFPCCSFNFPITNHMQELLHLFDMNFGGSISSEKIIPEKKREYYLLSSVMEEAIASSQMEGASTTRDKAKEMLRKQQKPKNVDQQMILNNYQTIRFLSENKDTDLTPEFLLEVHKKITNKTLENIELEGHFRKNNNIKVIDDLNNEVVHIPPSYTEININVKAICDFINDNKTYIHPIIKGIILHFMIAYLHPFVDGNGRTARALFYWYMLKNGYWLMEYMSISRVIYKNNKQYAKAYLYCENDLFDLGYFINYNLETLLDSFYELKKYLEKKISEDNTLFKYKSIPGINDRQAQIIQKFVNNPNLVLTCKDLEIPLNASAKTIRSDLSKLTDSGLLIKVAKNKRLVGYARSDDFEKLLKSL